jgi:hypothetical protein
MLTDWDHLNAATDRITRLTHQAQAAAAEGDNARARYFALKAKEASADRQLVLDRISAQV